MKRFTQTVLLLISTTTMVLPMSVQAASKSTAANGATTAAEQQRLTVIKTKGDQEISRRLASLSSLSDKINAAVKLSAADKATLSAEVTNEISGLQSLQSQLSSETTVAAAHTDAQSIISNYRVYALVTPKVWLVKTADDQQVVESKLQALATKLQTRITALKTSGKDVTSLQASLADLNSQVTAANGLSAGVETSIIGLQPTDYDSNHAVLSGDAAKVKTAHQDDQQAITDSKTIIAGLK